MKSAKASVIANTQVLEGFARPHARTVLGANLIWLDCPAIAKEARPGRFVMVRCGPDTTLPRPFSIHQVKDGAVALLFNVWEDGKGSVWLSQRVKGDSVELFGPLGNGFTIKPHAKNLLLVAGGIGVAPLCFLAEEALKRNCKIKFLIGGRTAAQLYPQNLSADGLEIIYTTEDATSGRPGRVTTFVPDYFDWADQIFACGPIPMYRNMAENFPQLKGHPVQVSLEVRMGCGLGVCYGCTVKTKSGLKQACKDGPVFNLQDVIWDAVSC